MRVLTPDNGPDEGYAFPVDDTQEPIAWVRPECPARNGTHPIAHIYGPNKATNLVK